MEEETTIIMAALSGLSHPLLTNLTNSILSLSHHHRRRLSSVLSSPTLFSLTLHHLLSLSLPEKTLLIARHLLSLLHPLTLHIFQPPPLLHHPSATTMRLLDLDTVVLLLFLCETHQLDPEALEASPDNWREVLSNIFSGNILTGISLWTCKSGVLIPYIETVSRCRRFVSVMGGGGGDGKEGREVGASRAAVVALPAVEVEGGRSVECVICKEEMREGRDVCEMPCKHLFHWMCILPWLRKRNTCPFCRFQLPTDDVFREIERLWGLLVKASKEY